MSRGPRGRLVAAGVVTASLAGAAAAQTVDTHGARTFVVGMPRGGARVDRVNLGRSGQCAEALPSSGLRIAWQTPFLGVSISHAPLVDGAGTTFVVGGQGDVVAISHDGTESWRASTGALQPGPAALASDGSVVFVDSNGEAVSVRQGHQRWRRRFGRADAAHPAPLPLEDGGVVVATSHELALLDADGNERARTALPEPATAPLIAAQGHVIVVAGSGTVYSWTLGGELLRVGSFGAPVDQGAALADDHTLLAVTSAHTHLTALDLTRGTATTRAVAAAGLWLGPPATSKGSAEMLWITQTSELVVFLDPSGAELRRAVVATRAPMLSPDGGPVAIVPPPRVPTIVDAAGTAAFVTTDGAGIVGGGAAEMVSDVCPAAGGGAAAGLAPLGRGAFVVACRAGSLVALSGQP